MQIVLIVLASMFTIVVIHIFTRRPLLPQVAIAVSFASAVTVLGLGFIAESMGMEWHTGVALFAAATLTLGLSALTREPPLRR